MTALRKALRRERLEPATREELIRRTTALLRLSAIFDVRADLKGYAAPLRIFWQRSGEGHLPDVTGGRYIIQVETAASLELEPARARCELFSAFSREHRYSFVVAVPAGCKRRMELQLAQWAMAATVWQL